MAKPPLQNLRAQQKHNFAIIRMAAVGFCWHSKAILGGEGILYYLFIPLYTSPSCLENFSPGTGSLEAETVSNPP